MRIGALSTEPAHTARHARDWNIPILSRLVTCLEANTCDEGEEKVVLLASQRFVNARNGLVSGEDIW